MRDDRGHCTGPCLAPSLPVCPVLSRSVCPVPSRVSRPICSSRCSWCPGIGSSIWTIASRLFPVPSRVLSHLPSCSHLVPRPRPVPTYPGFVPCPVLCHVTFTASYVLFCTFFRTSCPVSLWSSALRPTHISSRSHIRILIPPFSPSEPCPVPHIPSYIPSHKGRFPSHTGRFSPGHTRPQSPPSPSPQVITHTCHLLS